MSGAWVWWEFVIAAAWLALGCSSDGGASGELWACACRAECGDVSATESATACAAPRSDPADAAHLLELACNAELTCEGSCVCACINSGADCER